MNDWNIQSRAHACQSCEQRFSDKQHYFTLLFNEKHELKRLDVCEPCWKTKFTKESAPAEIDIISRWQGVYEAPPAAPPEAIQKETAETLLRKLIELNDPKHGGACFILAVMLERKRLLKEKEQIKQNGQRIIVYEQPRTGDIFTIADPDLQLDQLEEVQRDVANLLEHGLNVPGATAPESAAAAPATDASAPQAASPDAPAEPAAEGVSEAASADGTPQADEPTSEPAKN